MSSLVQRPRLARNGQRLDEKTATFFVDKAIKAMAADIEADDAIDTVTRRYGHSLGNVIGQQRYIDRLARHAGPATLYLRGRPHKKRFLLIRDFIIVERGRRLEIVRTTVGRNQRGRLGPKVWPPFIITRHALIRAVQWSEIDSVEDVFAFLKLFWAIQERFFLTLMTSKATTRRLTCWSIPARIGGTMMAMMIRRLEGGNPALVTIYPEDRIPTRLLAPMEEFQALVEDENVPTVDEWTERMVAILPRLVV